ncbi:MAG: MerR family transcriptional regulator [Acidimicrobiales bacterium]|jgi:DNA-binding transcriptional MerR regulator|nr:MerR family transcriptional regulator [Acidimicrobiales bacterium]
MDTGLTIGEFSRITHLSIKTLRRYHEAGLLQPARVDRQTGYRYYILDQVPTAQVIHRFRELDMPLREVGELLAVTDPDARAAVIAQHLQRLENQLDQTKAAVVALRRLLDPQPAALRVQRWRTEATTVAAVRGVVDRTHILRWYAEAMQELDSVLAVAGEAPTGPPGGLYDNELFSDERGTMVVYIPVARPPRSGEVEPFVIPAAELTTTTHAGPHDDIDVTYGALGTYVKQQALEVAGPVREIYRLGPRDTTDSSRWRTEIGWPTFQTVADPVVNAGQAPS